MAEEIPLDPFHPHGDEHTNEHDHETSFGERDDAGFGNDRAREEGVKRAAIDEITGFGFKAPSDVYYKAIRQGDDKFFIVSEDKVIWYKVSLGFSRGERVLSLMNKPGEPAAPDSFKQKFGLEVPGARPKDKIVEDIRERERNIELSGDFIKKIFVNPDFTKFKHGIDDFGRPFVKLMRVGAVEYAVNEDGTLSKGPKGSKPPEGLLSTLGIRKVDKIAENEAKIAANEAKIRQEREKTMTFLNKAYQDDDESEEEVSASRARSLFGTSTRDIKGLEEYELKTQEEIQGEIDETQPLLSKSSDPSTTKRLRDKIKGLKTKFTQSKQRYSRLREEFPQVLEREEEVTKLEAENEETEEENEELTSTLPLKERVKEIFRKHGVTVVGVLVAVGTVIGVIVSNLRGGLTKVAKGVGDGLKAIGSKLGQILPGMVGAIVSFLFKTAGEAVGFLAKHSWLLILLVVTFAVDQFKGKKE